VVHAAAEQGKHSVEQHLRPLQQQAAGDRHGSHLLQVLLLLLLGAVGWAASYRLDIPQQKAQHPLLQLWELC
jgi:hypothetical protein